MRNPTEAFVNRKEAGLELARKLDSCVDSNCIVLAIPRGGVVVGYEVAKHLNAPLDVIAPRKIPAPNQPELAIGAVASWGNHDRLIDEKTVQLLNVSTQYIDREVDRQLAEINRRLLIYRGTSDPPDVNGKQVILVDDGIATGYTTKAAILAVRSLKAATITLAAPVGPADSIEMLRPFVDDLICLRTPSPFMAVGYWYVDFEQVSDEEVVDLLKKAREL